MKNPRPFMLLRARAKAASSADFDRWFDSEHLRDVAGIPGISAVMGGRTAEGTRLGVYTFESAEQVQSALSSPQAAYARGTWERWQPDLEELLIEIWANVTPTPMFQGIN